MRENFSAVLSVFSFFYASLKSRNHMPQPESRSIPEWNGSPGPGPGSCQCASRDEVEVHGKKALRSLSLAAMLSCACSCCCYKTSAAFSLVQVFMAGPKIISKPKESLHEFS
jgi:hypothetical protein